MTPSDPALIAESVPASGRQRRKLAWSLGFKKCPSCREKALVIVKGKIVCNYCGAAHNDGVDDVQA